MMKPYVWSDGQSLEEQKNGAYWERNMLALYMAYNYDTSASAGWYYSEEGWEGWSRVISLEQGSITFHIPDDFDIGYLPEIDPNWDGHTTQQKWQHLMRFCGCEAEG